METIVLDFDGTIADTKNSIIKTVQATLKDLKQPDIDDMAVKDTIGLPITDMFVKAAHIHDDILLKRAIQIYRSKYNDISAHTVRLFPHVKETLETLYHKNITIAVASNKGKDALLTLLTSLNIGKYISLVLGEQDVINKKPAPDMVIQILEQTQSTPQKTLVVGDTVYDIAMGHSAKCLTCGVTYGINTRKQLEKQNADYIIDDFKEILNLI